MSLLFLFSLSLLQSEIPANPGPSPTVDQQVAATEIALERTLVEHAESASKWRTQSLFGGRVFLYGDSSTKTTKLLTKALQSSLAVLDHALPESKKDPEKRPLHAVVLKSERRYLALIKALSPVATSRQKAFLKESEFRSGFLFQRPPLVVVMAGRSEEETRVDHSLAHDLVHLELLHRFGEQPMWLREALACVVEDVAFGEVWAFWYREGFVYNKSHASWRDASRLRVLREQGRLDSMFTYPANPFEKEGAELSFSFALWALLEEPEALGGYLCALQTAYQKDQPKRGRFRLPASQQKELALASFGPDMEARWFQWWKQGPPARNKKR